MFLLQWATILCVHIKFKHINGRNCKRNLVNFDFLWVICRPYQFSKSVFIFQNRSFCFPVFWFVSLFYYSLCFCFFFHSIHYAFSKEIIFFPRSIIFCFVCLIAHNSEYVACLLPLGNSYHSPYHSIEYIYIPNADLNANE